MSRHHSYATWGGGRSCHLRRFCWFVLLLPLFVTSLPATAQSSQLTEEQLQRLRQRIESLQSDLQVMRGQHDKAQRELRSSEKKIGRLSRKLTNLKRQQRSQLEKLHGLERRKSQYQSDIDAQRVALERQVRAAYMTGRQEYMKMLLNQQDPLVVGRVLTYYDYFNRARGERINALNTSVEQLEKVSNEIIAERERIAQLRKQGTQEKQELEQSKRERHRLLAELKKDIDSHDKELSQLRQDEQRLEKLLGRLSEALEDIPAAPKGHKPFATLKGKLQWPVSGRIKASFGSRRSASLRWKGVLIEASAGKQVKAISHGRVAFADWLRGYGLLLIIDHGNGYMSLYGHNQSLLKEAGDWVETGEGIAQVGDSGGNDRAGLYFEIRYKGKPTDPIRWCVARR